MKIKMVLTNQTNLNSFTKEDLDHIDKKIQENLPAMYGKNLLNFDNLDQLFFSSSKNLNDLSNIDEILKQNYLEYALEDPDKVCHSLFHYEKKTNIFFITSDRDGNTPVLYKIEENNKEDRFYFNTSLFKGNIFEGPKQISKAIKLKKKNKIHQFEIKDESLCFFLMNEKLAKKIKDKKQNFISLLETEKKLKKLKVKNGSYSIYTFWDYEFGEENLSGFGHYGILLDFDGN